MTLTFGSLFSGIGGMDLGLERAGLRCAFQVEIEPYAQKVLKKHWPQVPLFSDVREVGAHNLPVCDVLAGGFPCQDISNAGKRAGLDGERSGLWVEFHRLIRQLRPRYVLVENVSALLARGLGRVLGDLATSGYDAEWDCLPAAAFGAHHQRDRLFVVAYPQREQLRNQPGWSSGPGGSGAAQLADDGAQGAVAHAHGQGQLQPEGRGAQERRRAGHGGEEVAHADRQGLAVGTCLGGDARARLKAFERSCSTGAGVWSSEPGVGGIVDGLPSGLDGDGLAAPWERGVPRVTPRGDASRVHRLKGLGNAVVPQVAQWLGERIRQHAEVAQ